MGRPFFVLDTGTVKAGIDQAKQGLDRGLDLVIEATKYGMLLFSEDLVSEAQGRISNRSGELSASGSVGEVRIEGDALVNDLGFNSEHGAQTDLGGLIRPKRGRLLAIPLEPILTGRGVARYSSPREEPDLELVKLAGKLFLVKKVARRSGERRFADFHWLLVPEVNQDGTGFFTDVLRERYDQAPEAIGQVVRNQLAGGPPAGGARP